MNEKIPAVLNSYVGDDTDLCYYVFDILRQEEKPEVGLQYFYENIRTKKIHFFSFVNSGRKKKN